MMSNELLRLAPCLMCKEPEKLSPELHVGTSLVVCEVCEFARPEVLPRGQKHEILAAVVRAWNGIPREIVRKKYAPDAVIVQRTYP